MADANVKGKFVVLLGDDMDLDIFACNSEDEAKDLVIDYTIDCLEDVLGGFSEDYEDQYEVADYEECLRRAKSLNTNSSWRDMQKLWEFAYAWVWAKCIDTYTGEVIGEVYGSEIA